MLERIQDLSMQIAQIKEYETEAKKEREAMEAELLELLHVDPLGSKTKTETFGSVKIQVMTRMNQKIDTELLEKRAVEFGLEPWLEHLFRWKPSINKKNWDEAPESVRNTLATSITETPGRPSVKITIGE